MIGPPLIPDLQDAASDSFENDLDQLLHGVEKGMLCC